MPAAAAWAQSLQITTLAGVAQVSGGSDGAGGAARFNLPQGFAVDTSGNLHVVDCRNCALRKVTPAGAVTTIAGTAGVAGSTGSAAGFRHPLGDAVDTNGNHSPTPGTAP
jgi:hypothetical protein